MIILLAIIVSWTLLIVGAVVICRAAAKETPVPEAVEEQKVAQSKASSH
jgi:hypothetical protein